MKTVVKKVVVVIIVVLLLFTLFFYRTRLYRIDWKREKTQSYEIENALELDKSSLLSSVRIIISSFI